MQHVLNNCTAYLFANIHTCEVEQKAGRHSPAQVQLQRGARDTSGSHQWPSHLMLLVLQVPLHKLGPPAQHV
jgi:hypothetical protein